MTFTRTDKFKALAIVHIFETSRPLGNFAACVVLGDGAGVSYGINQFTHRSGALYAVAKRYLGDGGVIGADVIRSRMAEMSDRSAAAIRRLATDAAFKNALRAAAATREMKAAQIDTANDLYLKPAIDICHKLGFHDPLSLAVIYDSVVHGSFNRVARTVQADKSAERIWITEYVRRRDRWLLSYTRLAATRYRTRFFLSQITSANWKLDLPLNVNGTRLGSIIADPSVPADAASPTVAVPVEKSVLRSAAEFAAKAEARFDQVEARVSAVTTRADSAKSMWATVGGTLWQALWAVFGFAAGLPAEVWITVAVIAGLLMLAYLYRQIALGRLREQRVNLTGGI
ncbi:MAG: chitosanase [Acidobacteriota bacterium]